MKTRFVLAGVLVFSLWIPVGSVVAQGSKSAGDEFVARMKKMAEVWGSLDPALAAPFYAKDPGLAFYDLMPMKYVGWDSYAKGVQETFQSFAAAKFTVNDDATAMQRGNVAWATATWHATLTSKDGSTQALGGRWTLVWEKRGKDWLIVHEHFSVPAPESPDPSKLSLYKRLGGYDAIAAVVDDFIGRMISDPQLNKFFAAASTDSKKHIRQLVVDQLCAATGGPCIYTGRTMRASHEGLGITEADWNRAVGHLVATFDKFKVGKREKDEVLGALSGLKPDIVAK